MSKKQAKYQTKLNYIAEATNFSEKEILPCDFPNGGLENEIAEFNGALNAILQTIDASKYEQEKKYIKEAFDNARNNFTPWTTLERIGYCAALALMVVPSAVILGIESYNRHF